MLKPREVARRIGLAVVLALSLTLAPLVAQAQQADKARRIGWLSMGTPTTTSFLEGLRELGWIEGRNLVIERRYAEGDLSRLPNFAAELVRLPVEIIIAGDSFAIDPARKATKTLPIVMTISGDPVGQGWVESLGRPGGNITGLTLLNDELTVKQLELLKEVVPRMSRVAALGSSAVALTPKGRQALDSAARTLGIQLLHVEVRDSVGLDSAFADAVRANANAVLIRADPFVLEANDRRVVTLADKHRLPAVYWMDTYAQLGGLMSYGADLLDVHRRSASYVDRILKGARPADLPIEEPAKFELIVNLKTARTLGLTVPPSVLARANEVIK